MEKVDAPRVRISGVMVAAGWLSVSVSLFLLLLNAIGYFVPPVEDAKDSSRIAGYDYRTISIHEAKRQARDLRANHSEAATDLLKLVSGSFIHSESYKISPFDNWLIWTLSKLTKDEFTAKALLDTQDGELLWRRGGGFCHQAASIYAQEAQKIGLKAHLVRLNGHYVAEVAGVDGMWRVADPDIGIFWAHPLEHFGTSLSESKIAERIMENGFSEASAKHLAAIYASSEDNIRLYSYSLPKFIYIERLTLHYRWIIPTVGALIGIILILLGRKRTPN